MRDVVDSVDLWSLRSRDRFRNPRRGDPEHPRRVGEGQPEAREEAFTVLAIGHDLPPLDPAEDDMVRCPRGIQPCLSWHPRAGPRLESWGTPSELFLSVNNVPYYER